jgi:hypothetical protein
MGGLPDSIVCARIHAPHTRGLLDADKQNIPDPRTLPPKEYGCVPELRNTVQICPRTACYLTSVPAPTHPPQKQ